MYIKIKSLKNFLCNDYNIPCFAFLAGLMSPLPSLLPYVFFFINNVVVIGKESSYLWNLKNIIEVEITLFFILVNVSTFCNFTWD